MIQAFAVIQNQESCSLQEYLTSWNVKEAFTSNKENFFLHCSTILQEVELNSFHGNPYKLGEKSFNHLFSQFKALCQESIKDSEFVFKVEAWKQMIHLVSGVKNTEYILPFLPLLEDVCLQKNLCNLLQSYQQSFDASLQLTYPKWARFLEPFLEFLAQKQFNFPSFFASGDLQTIFQENREKLQELFAQKGIEFNLQEDIKNREIILQEITILKERLSLSFEEKNENFFFGLGTLSFIFHLVDFQINKEHTFLDLCLLITPYTFFKNKSALEESTEIKLIKHSNFRKDWSKFLKTLMESIKQYQGERAPQIRTLTCAIELINTQKETYFFPTKDSTVFSQLLNTISEHRDSIHVSNSPFRGEFMDCYNDLLLQTIQIISDLFESSQTLISSNFQNQLEAQNDLFKQNGVRSIVKIRYSHLLYQKSSLSYTSKKQLIKNYNLSDKPISDFISLLDSIDPEGLLINLTQTQHFFEKDPYYIDEIDHDNFKNSIRSFVRSIEFGAYSSAQIKKLKLIGIFFLRMIIIKKEKWPMRKVKSLLITSTFHFLLSKCTLSLWDAYLLQDIWSLIQTQNYESLYLSKEMEKFLELQKWQRKEFSNSQSLCWNERNQILRQPDVKKKFSQLILTWLDEAIKIITNLWNSNFDNPKGDSFFRLREECKEFIYGVLPWANSFLQLMASKATSSLNILDPIFFRLIPFLSHPVFSYFLEESETPCIVQSQKIMFSYANFFYQRNFEDWFQATASQIEIFNPLVEKRVPSFEAEVQLLLKEERFDFSAIIEKNSFSFSKEALTLVSFLRKWETWKSFLLFDVYRRVRTESAKNIISLLLNLITNLTPVAIKQGLDDSNQSNLQFLFINSSLRLLFSAFSHLSLNSFHSEKMAKIIEHSISVERNKFSNGILNQCFTILSKGEVDPKEIWTILFRNNTFSLFLFDVIVNELPDDDLSHEQLADLLRRFSNRSPAITLKSQDVCLGLLEKLEKIDGTRIGNRKKLLTAILRVIETYAFGLFSLIKKSILELETEIQNSNSLNEALENREKSEEIYLEKTGQRQTEFQTAKENLALLQKKLYSMICTFFLYYDISDSCSMFEQSLRDPEFNDILKIFTNFLDTLTKKGNLFEEIEDIERVMKFAKHPFLNCLLTIEVYFTPIMNIFYKKRREPEQVFFDSVIENFRSLTKQLLLQNSNKLTWLAQELQTKKEEVIRIHRWLRSLSDVLYANYRRLFLENKFTENAFISVFDDVQTFFNLIDKIFQVLGIPIIQPAGEYLQNIIGLIQIALYSSPPQASSYLLEKTDILQSLLSMKISETSWFYKNAGFVVSALDALFWNALPSEIHIETQVSKCLMKSLYQSKPKVKLSDLITEETLLEEKTYTEPETLTQVLKAKFHVNLEKEGVFDSTQNIQISFKIETPKENSLTQIICSQRDRILQNLSPNAKAALDLLVNTFIRNFLSNLYELQACHNNSVVVNKVLFKETTTILNLISTILEKYPFLNLYLLEKKNYSSIVSPYISKIQLLDGVNINSFESITFLECLVKTKYFSLEGIHLISLIGSLISPTGVAFIDPQDSQIYDFSNLIKAELLEFLNQELESAHVASDGKFNRIEHFSVWYAVSHAIVWFWTCLKTKETNEQFITQNEKWYKANFWKAFMNLIKTLSGPRSLGDTEKLFRGFLNDYFEDSYSKLKVTKKIINEVKWDHYEEFLDSVTANYREELKQVDYKSRKTETPQFYQSISRDEVWYLTGTIRSILSGKPKQNIKFELPGKGTTKYCSTWNWTTSFSTYTSMLAELKKNCSPEQSLIFNHYDICFQKTIPSFGSTQTLLLQFPSTTYLVAPPVIEDQVPDPRPKLCAMLVEEEKQQEHKDKKSENSQLDRQAEPSSQIQHESVQKRKIKYFIHPTLQNPNQLQTFRRDTLIRVKILHEKLSVGLASFTVSPNQDLQEYSKELVKTLLDEMLSSLEPFERNFLLCSVKQEAPFQSFAFPDDFEDILSEYQWIQQDFVEYLSVLNEIRSFDPSIAENKISHQPPLIQEFDNLFPPNFSFCLTGSKAQNQDSTHIEIIRKNINIFRIPFEVEEEFIESILSFVTHESPASRESTLFALCSWAPIELNVLDFCFTFLYSPNMLETFATEGKKFIPFSQLTPGKNSYQNVAERIMLFLKKYIENNQHVLNQRLSLLEKRSLKIIQEFKDRNNYQQAILGMTLVCDLILGLSTIQPIMENLSKALKELLKVTFLPKLENHFMALPTKDSKSKEINRFDSSKNLTRVLHLLEFGGDCLFVFHPKIHLKIIDEEIEVLSPLFEQINLTIKPDLENPERRDDVVKELKKFESLLVSLKYFSSFCCNIINWELEKDKPHRMNPESETRRVELFEELNTRFFSNSEIENFFLSVFELLDNLVKLTFPETNPIASLINQIAELCTDIYSLVWMKHEIAQCLLKNKEDSDLPFLTTNKSRNNPTDLPSLQSSFSHLRRTRELDFDILYADMAAKNPQIIQAIFQRSTTKKTRGRLFGICQRIPWIVDLAEKKRIFQEAMNKNLSEASASGKRDVEVHRNNILNSTIEAYSMKEEKLLKSRVRVYYKGEAGYDAGGLRREWITLVCKELFDPQFGLFEVTRNGTNLQISPISHIVHHHLRYFEFAGIMLAKAIQEEDVVDVSFTKSLLKHILRRPLSVNDLEDIDAEHTKGLRWILENSVEGLEETFSYEVTVFGERTRKDLIPNGDDILVTDDNKVTFVNRLCDMKMRGEIQEELQAFLKGFNLIVPSYLLSMFSPSELQLLIAGVSVVDINELEKNAVYVSCKKEDTIVKWLWEILREFNERELAAFIFFVSGSVKPPHQNDYGKRFRYRRGNFDITRLPLAHTCSFELEFPEYGKKEDFKHKLLLAIFEGQGGGFWIQ